MNACEAKDIQELLAYWLGELGEARELDVEKHLFMCRDCGARLKELIQLRTAVRAQLLNGAVRSVLSPQLIERLRDAGFRVREYRLQPGASVHCTVTSQDDFVVAHLQAPLKEVQRLDLKFEDAHGAHGRRAQDIAFDPRAGQVVYMSSVQELRAQGVVTQRVQLIAVDGSDERVIASYTFNHSPSSA